ncbi:MULTISPECIES: PPOX class F420-dependent oxidoreductase [Nonomuraea]|jgi:pyridoxamine 5'-phosphate oxidase family protein|uniref:PPOX class F420-dependent oxidoreductase n=2 Tax=Nonomuraea TaxID=83681 RepID=A0ABW1BSC1_9ACTN|nr:MULTISPECIES: PPOX class F420-dependent oxidoreductase [Nonomuraea]MDA0641524.1 PPOX class F420-dependent oxidoreductase [Nonomuraea ferruginea]
MRLTESELAFLSTQRLGRLATVAPGGQVQNNPVGFFVDAEAGTIDIGGLDLAATKKFRNVRAGSTVSLVVDELASVSPWIVRGVEIRGTAEALTGVRPPRPGMSDAVIRVKPAKVISWGLPD